MKYKIKYKRYQISVRKSLIVIYVGNIWNQHTVYTKYCGASNTMTTDTQCCWKGTSGMAYKLISGTRHYEDPGKGESCPYDKRHTLTRKKVVSCGVGCKCWSCARPN